MTTLNFHQVENTLLEYHICKFNCIEFEAHQRIGFLQQYSRKLQQRQYETLYFFPRTVRTTTTGSSSYENCYNINPSHFSIRARIDPPSNKNIAVSLYHRRTVFITIIH